MYVHYRLKTSIAYREGVHFFHIAGIRGDNPARQRRGAARSSSLLNRHVPLPPSSPVDLRNVPLVGCFHFMPSSDMTSGIPIFRTIVRASVIHRAERGEGPALQK